MLDRQRIARGLYWDRAWSLIDGCSKVSESCKFCWSEKQSFNYTFQTNPKFQRYKDVMDFNGNWNGRIIMRWDNLGLPLRVKKPQVFAIWNDLLHDDVSPDFIYKVFETMWLAERHIFLLLTKRAENLALLDDIYFHLKRNYPDIEIPLKNVCLGVTAENQAMADARIPLLLETLAAWRFVSIEPMLKSINLDNYIGRFYCNNCFYRGHKFAFRFDDDYRKKYQGKCKTYKTPGCEPCGQCEIFVCPECEAEQGEINAFGYAEDFPERKYAKSLDWVICGEENAGPKSRPVGIEAIRDLKDQCVEADVPFFLKQMRIDGKLVKLPELDGQQWSQFPGIMGA